MSTYLAELTFRIWAIELAVSGVNYFVVMKRIYEPRVGELHAHQIGMSTRIVYRFVFAYILLARMATRRAKPSSPDVLRALAPYRLARSERPATPATSVCRPRRAAAAAIAAATVDLPTPPLPVMTSGRLSISSGRGRTPIATSFDDRNRRAPRSRIFTDRSADRTAIPALPARATLDPGFSGAIQLPVGGT